MIFRRKKAPAGRHRLSQAETQKSLGRRFSYRSRRSDTEQNIGRQLQRQEKKQAGSRHAKNLIQKLGLIILMLAVLASAINIVTLSTKPKVLPLEGEQANFLHDTSVYEEYASQVLTSSVWNHNKITVNTSDVSNKLVSQFPELASASLTVPLLAHRPIIYIQPSKPVLVIQTKNGSFVVATSGKALLRANTPEELQKYNLPLLEDQSGLKLQVGHQALQAKDVEFVQTVITELASKQLVVSKMSLPQATSELDVMVSGQQYLVKFNLQSDTARQQAGTFLSTIGYLQKQNLVPVKYVDVRVNGRAYYQ